MKLNLFPKIYTHSQVEKRWYAYWLENNFFSSEPNYQKKPYTIVIPPPNITGILHMGHILNSTLQDVLVRRERMKGKEACWVPGIDHASIATEAKVAEFLRKEKKIQKFDITREEFLKYAWEWKEKYGYIILKQLKHLGISCDWNRTRFTLDENLSKSVTKVFVDLYRKGYIYRGVRMVNWDPKGKTVISDEEVVHKKKRANLYYIKYFLSENTNNFLTVATTRPETILADTALCVHPEDERYVHLLGKTAIVPIIHRKIPIISDTYVDSQFGTGCLKVTPAHDSNDYQIALRNKLEIIDIISEDGKLNKKAFTYTGKKCSEARKLIISDLEKKGQIVKIETIVHGIGFSERTGEIIEPKLSMQWFLRMKDMAKPALESVMNNTIQFYPSKFKNVYKHWMENIRDWCISRQLWWGHRIPVYHLPNGSFIVAETRQDALKKAQSIDSTLSEKDLKQDKDILDTWFSSWLWPISVFDGFTKPNNKDINYYYPTDDLVTAPEILFFWVARMIMASYEYKNTHPFKRVYFTGIVRDKKRKKMSKSLGNSPDPIDLIKKYGADSVRVGMLLCSNAGNDLLFDEKLCLQGRNFSNKIWNVFRLIRSWKTVDTASREENRLINEWFESKLNFTLKETEQKYTQYRISEVLMTTYRFFWDDFCSRYLECIKPPYNIPIDREAYLKVIFFFKKLIKILHPFMPFITEEIWQNLRNETEERTIIIARYPSHGLINEEIIENVESVFKIISQIRDIKNQQQANLRKAKAVLLLIDKIKIIYKSFFPLIQKLTSVSRIDLIESKALSETEAYNYIGNSNFSSYRRDDFFLILETPMNYEKERTKLLNKLGYVQEFLNSVEKKLSDENFLLHAPPQIINREKNKKKDALQKRNMLILAIEELSN